MIAGHRWQYDFNMRESTCVGLPIGGVESYQWCIGCGAKVSDKELCDLKLPRQEVFLDIIAHSHGQPPIQAGTYQADRFLSKAG